MGTLYLVRHGQASFGADDYDRLSELGWRQSRRLGEYWREQRGADLRPVAVLTGSLLRQRQTWEGIAEGAGLDLPRIEWPGLNEYDSHAIVHAIHPDPLPPATTPEGYRQHFKLLRQGLQAWMRGETTPHGMPSYADFAAGVAGALGKASQISAENEDGDVLLVSSGGPISTAVGQVLGMAPAASIELNMRIRNSAVTELVRTPRRLALLSFNTLAHLDAPAYRGWMTYA